MAPDAGVARPSKRTGVFASHEQWFAATERALNARAGAEPIADLVGRRRACVSGVIRSVTLRPKETVPAYEIEVYDGTGTLRVTWLGRRRVLGVEPGRRIVVTGLVSVDRTGDKDMFNPAYRLLARPGES